MPDPKLIRDRLPALAPNPMTVRTATAAEMPRLLLAKLAEETAEVRSAGPDTVLEELADVLEVVYALAEWHGCDRGNLRELARLKAAERGGFAGRVVWLDLDTGLARLVRPREDTQ